MVLVGLQLRTALRTQFTESYAHAKETLKNHHPENSSLAGYHTPENETTSALLKFYIHTYPVLYA